jgi:hypothetical protein
MIESYGHWKDGKLVKKERVEVGKWDREQGKEGRGVLEEEE